VSTPEPLVSIVMSMQDSAATLAPAIRSIQRQTLTDWELILLDDGSRDASADIAASFSEPRLRLVSDARRLGLPVRLNQGVALARGRFIARMDADDVCFPERLARQAALFQHDEALDVVGCRALVFSGAQALGVMDVGADHIAITAHPFDHFALPHPTWFGRAAWFKANPYDEQMIKAQDQELLLRTFRHSRFGSTTEVLVGYRQDRLSLAKSLQGRRLFAAALLRNARVHGNYADALQGVVRHGVKAAADVAAAGLGLQGARQRRRLLPVPPETLQVWTQLAGELGLTKAGEPCVV
jgi:glycosyltransferase involved in cell wall biosynthesis